MTSEMDEHILIRIGSKSDYQLAADRKLASRLLDGVRNIFLLE